MDWPNFLRGIFCSFLPKQFWGSWRPSSTVDFTRSAFVSGLFESAICASLLIQGYVHFLVIRTHQMQAAAQANEGTQLYFLVMLTIEYMFHPLSLIAVYLVGEGILRSWAAFFTDEVIPSLPIKLFGLVQDRRKALKQKAALGPPLPDLLERVQGQGCDLKIASHIPKDGWRASITVGIEGEFTKSRELKPVMAIEGLFIYFAGCDRGALSGDYTATIHQARPRRLMSAGLRTE